MRTESKRVHLPAQCVGDDDTDPTSATAVGWRVSDCAAAGPPAHRIAAAKDTVATGVAFIVLCNAFFFYRVFLRGGGIE